MYNQQLLFTGRGNANHFRGLGVPGRLELQAILHFIYRKSKQGQSQEENKTQITTLATEIGIMQCSQNTTPVRSNSDKSQEDGTSFTVVRLSNTQDGCLGVRFLRNTSHVCRTWMHQHTHTHDPHMQDYL